MAKLSVNLNKIALLRNARPLSIPQITKATQIVLYDTEASGITVHPRPDQRHIRYTDVSDIAKILSQFNSQTNTRIRLESASRPSDQKIKTNEHKELNIEGNPFHSQFLELIDAIQPHQCTLVPDEPGQQTSDHGWTDLKSLQRLAPIIEQLKQAKIRISLFMDPIPQLIEKAIVLKPDAIELYTEPYTVALTEYLEAAVTNSFDDNSKSISLDTITKDLTPRADNLRHCLQKYQDCAKLITANKILVHAGHDLNVQNLPLLLQMIPNIHEVSIGHALIADSIFHGLKNTVQSYLQQIRQASSIQRDE